MKKIISSILVILISVVLVVSLVLFNKKPSKETMVKNKEVTARTGDTRYYDWSQMTKLDKEYSYSTVFLISLFLILIFIVFKKMHKKIVKI